MRMCLPPPLALLLLLLSGLSAPLLLPLLPAVAALSRGKNGRILASHIKQNNAKCKTIVRQNNSSSNIQILIIIVRLIGLDQLRINRSFLKEILK